MPFYTFKALVRALLLPPTGLLILALLGVALLALNHRRSGWSCVLAGLAGLWLLSMNVVGEELTRLTQVYPAFDSAKPTNAQAIVILGGAVERSFAPEYPGVQFAASHELLERLNYGAWLSRTTHLPILVSSIGENGRTMTMSLSRDFQIRPRWVDLRSHDTFENARNSAALLRAEHVNSILLVTSDTHMLRATREFLATGLQVTPAPVHVLAPHIYHEVYDYLPSAEGMMDSNRAIYELVGERARKIMVALNVRRQQPG
jgi:uncharacterized SAM-binding protein YcdF (DUF218 family)